jgi:hypothetical protein
VAASGRHLEGAARSLLPADVGEARPARLLGRPGLEGRRIAAGQRLGAGEVAEDRGEVARTPDVDAGRQGRLGRALRGSDETPGSRGSGGEREGERSRDRPQPPVVGVLA